jgi:chemotaxis protein CheY-P-specific phosphatase CheC
MGVSLVALELDALRETANIATARAARALAEFTRRTVWMSPPEVHWSPGPLRDRSLGTAGALVAVGAAVRGALCGSLLFLAPAESVRGIARMLLGPRHGGDPTDPVVRSCVVETANILGGTYLSALATLTGGVFHLEAPRIGYAPEPAVWDDLTESGEFPVAGLCLETELSIGNVDHTLPCRLFLLGDRGALASTIADLKAWG